VSVRTPTTAAASPVHRQVEQLMGMPISLALRGRHATDDRGRDAWTAALSLLREADRVFSTYRPDSWVSRLGRGEVEVGDCPPEVADVLALGERARRESAGAFDVRRTDASGATVLDPSGVVKGWALVRAAAMFEPLPETDVCLSAGGDLVCRTASPGSPGWRIGIEDPADPTRLVAVVPVRNGAVATSGATHRGPHVAHGATGAVPTTVASVTVLAPTLTEADIDATSAFALDRDALSWLRTRPGRRGLVVWADGRTDVFSRPRGSRAGAAGPPPPRAGSRG
jgi:thiamine biosynthesis lipoprotein